MLLGQLDNYIETHNEALDVAQKAAEYKYNDGEVQVVSEIDQALYIDKSTITPDQDVIEEHTTKLKEIFWNF